jgi:hypothetical protein
MSLLNKFIAPELKIKSKGSQGAKKASGKNSASRSINFGTAAGAKTGLLTSAFTKPQVAAQGVQGGGGGGKK